MNTGMDTENPSDLRKTATINNELLRLNELNWFLWYNNNCVGTYSKETGKFGLV